MRVWYFFVFYGYIITEHSISIARLAIISGLALGALINATILGRSKTTILHYTTYEYIHCFFLTSKIIYKLKRQETKKTLNLYI